MADLTDNIVNPEPTEDANKAFADLLAEIEANTPAEAAPVKYGREYIWLLDDASQHDPKQVLMKSETITPDSFIIRDELKKRYIAFDFIGDYQVMYPAGTNFLTHEIILPDVPQRLMFDFDSCTLKQYNDIKGMIEVAFMDEFEHKPRFIELDSSDETKFSRHLIIAGHCVENYEQAKWFTDVCVVPLLTDAESKVLDTKINKRNTSFRCPGATKNGRMMRHMDPRVEEIDSGFVTWTVNAIHLPIHHIDDNKALGYNTELVADHYVAAADREIDARYPGVWKQLKVKRGFITYFRMLSAPCEVCNRAHDSNNMYVTSNAFYIKMKCHANKFGEFKTLWSSRTSAPIPPPTLAEPTVAAPLAILAAPVANAVADVVAAPLAILAAIPEAVLAAPPMPISRFLDPKHEVWLGSAEKYELAEVVDLEEFKQFIFDTIVYIRRRKYYIVKTQSDTEGFEIDYHASLDGLLDTMNILNPKYIAGKSRPDERIIEVEMTKIVKGIRKHITYHKDDFVPFLTQLAVPFKAKTFNTFIGFAHPYRADFVVDEAKIKLVNDHIFNIWCQKDPKLYKYIKQYLAHIIQRPATKMGVAVVLRSSKQGAGKNVILDFIGNHVIGERYYYVLNKVDDLVGNFNAFLANRLLTVCDEMQNYGGTRQTNDVMKSLVTQKKLNMTRKGLDTTRISDYNNYFMLTNNDWPVKIEATDRRYLALDCSNEKANNREYFAPIYALGDDEGLHYFHHLASIPLDDFKPSEIPDTDLRAEIKKNGEPLPIKFMDDILTGDYNIHGLWSGDVANPLPTDELCKHTQELYNCFVQWRAAAGNDKLGIFDRSTFSKEINKLDTIKSKEFRIQGVKKWGFGFTRQQLRDAIAAYRA